MRRGVAHGVEQEVVDTRLVEDDVRELGEAVLGILDAAAADDRAIATGFPERGFVHPVGLAQHPLAEAECLEHLHRAARDTVGLTNQKRTGFLVDDARPDRRERGELGGERQAGRSTPDDQHVDIPAAVRRRARLGDRRVAGAVAI